MAEVVGGFLMPHNPALSGVLAGMAKPEQEDTINRSFEHISERVAEMKADTVIIIGDDHYTNFGPHCIPTCLIAIGDLDGPIEEWLPIEKGVIPNNEGLARHILESGLAEGVDWSYAKSITLDHATAIPYEMAVKFNPAVNIIPIYLNCVMEPFIDSRRAYDIGRSIKRAVESWGGNERVVIYGTGGLSHWVGSPGMGNVNEAFDRKLLDLCAAGDIETLLSLSDEEILREGGNGAIEVKNWYCAMGAMPGAKAEFIAYEAMHEWLTGMGFAELKQAA
ncbi:protocatechuate 4,5-dioxygenase subunit beta [Novosphingobium pentaromativorans]|uniref:Protocatechuate 4,5-dioxygenase subunit beta n=1 Tax=Novosphingobium pentaromativorans US6-1 TaxID=1088721 RepID=G6EGK0_9SPHN|nr:protocatechuate 4,5-dioxygenase subunit beta [Novosphingobium pentaromativorans]AIT82168.1 protocatechuate 3,4-dioxygenase [Novosphingobium pentaromativorans US6-1]EHJ59547.1 protocatechuate 4,5-dioxygenase subunit beta [Novosphingobium pentaromativorans US6-1]